MLRGYAEKTTEKILKDVLYILASSVDGIFHSFVVHLPRSQAVEYVININCVTNLIMKTREDMQ